MEEPVNTILHIIHALRPQADGGNITSFIANIYTSYGETQRRGAREFNALLLISVVRIPRFTEPHTSINFSQYFSLIDTVTMHI